MLMDKKFFKVFMKCGDGYTLIAVFYREDMARDYCSKMNVSMSRLVPHSYYYETCFDLDCF